MLQSQNGGDFQGEITAWKKVGIQVESPLVQEIFSDQ